ncbi:hypothetical protein U8V72_23715 [Priestia filamentosa]|uniref:hypothetical protein n=1 Tax=Priestia filamentosa TaxID=1402861 RepID=UPI000588F052
MSKGKKLLIKSVVTGSMLAASCGGGMLIYKNHIEAKEKAEVVETAPVKTKSLKERQIKATESIAAKLRDEFSIGGPVGTFKYNFNSVDAFNKSLLAKEDDGKIKKFLKSFTKELIGREYNVDLEAEFKTEFLFKKNAEVFVEVTKDKTILTLNAPVIDFEPNYPKTKFDSDVGAFLELLQFAIPEWLSDKYPSLQFTYSEEDRKQLFLKSVEVGQKKLKKEQKDEIQKLEEETIEKISNFVSSMSESEDREVVIKKNYDYDDIKIK